MKKWSLENKEGYITLEFTSHCNLDCVMCDTGKTPVEKRHHLDFKLFARIIDSLAKSEFSAGTIVPFWLGEPMLNPNFADMLEYAAIRLSGIAIEVHTNATLLTQEISKRLLENPILRRIVLSLDAANEETYKGIRRGGNFLSVIQNVKGFVELRSKAGKKSPLLVFQFIAMEQNAKEKDEFVVYWRNFLYPFDITPKLVFSEQEYPSDNDCIFVRPLNTSALYLGQSKAVFAIARGEKSDGISEYFNVILPFFRLKTKIPESLYDALASAPETILRRCNFLLDLNIPNSSFTKRDLAGMVDEKTSVNVGFSSASNFDNLLDIFVAFKQVDPFVRNILVFDGMSNQAPKSIAVDEVVPLEQFDWNKLPLSERHQPLPERELKRVLLIMPEVYFKGDYGRLAAALNGFRELGKAIQVPVSLFDINTQHANGLKRELVKASQTIIYQMYPNTNAVLLGKKIKEDFPKIELFFWNRAFQKTHQLWFRTRGNGLAIDLRKRATAKVFVVSPTVFSKFQVEMLSAESEIIRGIRRMRERRKRMYELVSHTSPSFAAGIRKAEWVLEETLSPVLFNANLHTEDELFQRITEDSPVAVALTNYEAIRSDTPGLAERIKRKFPSIMVIVNEQCKYRVRRTSYKPGVDLVLHNIDWEHFPIELVVHGTQTFSDVWYQKKDFRAQYSFLEFNVGKKKCTIISGKKELRSKPSLDINILEEFQEHFFGRLGMLAAVPKIFSRSVAEAAKAKRLLPILNGGLDVFDLNIDDSALFFQRLGEASLAIILNLKTPNNSFELIEEIKRLSPQTRVGVIEHNPRKIKETAVKVDFVIDARADVGRILRLIPSPEALLQPGVCFRFGGGFVMNESKEQVQISGQAHEPEDSTFQIFDLKGSSSSLIIPKFYEKYPAGVYELARTYYAAVSGLTYQDGNIIPIIPDKQVNCSIFIEGFKSNLLDVFGEAKKSNPSARNCVIYYGSNVNSARKLLLHPHVDCLVYASGTTSDFLKSLLEGNADMSKISFKYGGNVINSGMLPGPLPKINSSLTSSDLELSSSVDGGKLSSSLAAEFKSETASLIIPLFYSPFPKGVYKTAERILDAGINFSDCNFGAAPSYSKINFGVWIEGIKCDLIDTFSNFKNCDKEVRNIAIYQGTNQKKAMEVFVNPNVDALIYSSHAISSFIKSLVLGKVELKKIIFKHKENLIGQDQIPPTIHLSTSTKTHWALSFALTQPGAEPAVIDALKWQSASWDRFGPRIWKGDEQYSQGLSTAFGDDYGYFEYSFDCPLQGAQRLDIFAKVSSHSHEEDKTPDAASDVTLLINGEEIETRTVFFESNRSSFVEHWKIEGVKLKSKGNSLTFKVKKTAKHRKGLTIYGSSLTDEHKQLELPILLFFRK